MGPLGLLRKDKMLVDRIIYIDGGLHHKIIPFKSKKITSVGDMDSGCLMPEHLYPREKDNSDLYFALKLIKEKNCCLFCDGLFVNLKKEKRLDHFLANIGEIYSWAKKMNGMAYLSPWICLLPKGTTFLTHNGNFSVMAIDKTELSISGEAKYKIKTKRTISPLSSEGISNYGSGKLKIVTNRPLLFISTRNKLKF